MSYIEALIWNVDSVKHTDTEVTLSFAIKNLPEAVNKIARKIDGKNFADDCFGFAMTYNIKTKRYSVVSPKEGEELYYIDDDGERHSIAYKIPHGTVRSGKSKVYKKVKELLNITSTGTIKKEKMKKIAEETIPQFCEITNENPSENPYVKLIRIYSSVPVKAQRVEKKKKNKGKFKGCVSGQIALIDAMAA